uniref:putative F-box protein At3g16590 n=1 Tax=Erigeron canadensis TaxID=72917 RepID=UPI001CB94E4C|nr:putative F-box protein At3g16590 [Erigeron canadensis]XP_043632451.1 putative F-box protein At3g16590 [Erigeron canadensis]XP_043632452.1 putative F-box protein At3g16590 [Erigeron canadensis]
MSEYIPIEIQGEILKRLPVKPLVQFRSVSKSWKSLIDSPDFIVSYGVRHPHPERFILRYADPVYRLDYPEECKYISLVDNDDHSLVQQDLIPTVPGLINALGPESNVVGSSKGLLCLFKVYPEYPNGHPSKRRGIDMVYLWNPSIRKSICIQVPYISNENFGNNRLDGVIGFGVCPASLDPTVLKIKYNYSEQNIKDMPGINVPWKVGVFTLSTGSWSILSTNLPCESIRLRGSQVVIDRFIYWVAYDLLDAEDGRFLIMSFDLTTKEFKAINLTDSLTIRLSSIQSISKLHDSLVLLEYQTEFVSLCCWCVWMMEEQGDSRLFTKLYSINLPNATIHQILGFRKIGELILETREEFEQHADIQIYKQNYEYTDNLGIDGEPYMFFMCSYMETLLLLDQSTGYIYSNNM